MNKCRTCNAGQDYQSVRASYVFGGEEKHKFYSCSQCDLVYLWPVPTKEEEKIFYAKEFEKIMEKRSGKDRDWSGPEEHVKTYQKYKRIH